MKIAERKLKILRSEIDAIDRALLKCLGRRMKTAQRVGAVKRTHDIAPLQQARWAEVSADRVRRGRLAGLDQTFVKKLFNLIHEESLKIQRKKRR